jgi:hypothetical protein
LPRPTPQQWLGAVSCASAGCHNANGLLGERGSEYTTWITHDRHARAYEVLFNAESRNIVKHLFRAEAKAPHETNLCLNCHVHREFESANHQRRYSKEDGVSCESCHGPAGGWISEHYKPGWNRKDMRDTRSIAGRVETCAACHVGAPGMEVNHDLIAAGHPRLAFDFSAYHALMPHHWQDARDKQRDDWDAAAWFVGEIATTKAALELLQSRAQGKVWPEFAEADCYACHHQLKDQNWRQKRDFGQRKPGALPWNDWYVNSLPYTAPAGQALGWPEELGKLKQLMESQAVPDRKAVQAQTGQAIKTLNQLSARFTAQHYSSKDMAAILEHLVNRGATQKAGSWDEAAKHYLAVVAVHQAWRDARGAHAAPPDVKDALVRIRTLLQSTSGGDGEQGRYTPELLLEPFGSLKKHLGS